MNAKQNFTIQALVATLVLNAILLGALYFLLGDALVTSGQLAPFLVVGIVLTLVLAAIIALAGRRAIDQAESAGRASAAAAVTTSKAPPVTAAPPAPQIERAPTPPKAAPVQPPQPAPTASALQMLSILQREGRLIDFLQEDLSLYEDDQIGAAVRSIHAGCKGALESHVTLEPVVADDEGSTITVPAGFDAHAIRLTGSVSGEPPFKGWCATGGGGR
ncbi:MAG: DUF2760 domain-containing protein [Caldilineaceae bacterium]